MPHDAHFLQRLDRVRNNAHLDFAMSFYRDHEAVRFVLSRLTFPPGVDRVALALADTQRGPFMILQRDEQGRGHFVTCLGEGMSPGPWPVVPRASLDAHLAKLEDTRAREATYKRALRPRESSVEFFGRMMEHGMRLAREEFVAISTFQPLVGNMELLGLAHDFARDALGLREVARKIRRVRPRDVEHLRALHRMEWLSAHSLMLAGMGERAQLDEVVDAWLATKGSMTPTLLVSMLMGTTFLVRSAWFAARLGKRILPLYERALEREDDTLAGWADAAAGIAAIGLRHSGATSDAVRILSRVEAAASEQGTDASKRRAAYAVVAREAIEKADERARIALEITRPMVFDADRPEGHPLHFAREEDVPDDLARTMALSVDADTFDPRAQQFAFVALPHAARASAEDFYWARDVMRAMQGEWDAGETFDRMQRFNEGFARPEPVRAQPRPGRNDPCPCGSGNKYKRCCGQNPGAKPLGTP